ncbi:hypothetical protein S83_056065, partial [Arachis hypogaea]
SLCCYSTAFASLSRSCISLLLAVLCLVASDSVPEDCVDPRWKWFKGCLGALDGTYIDVTVLKSDKSRYRTRKSRISTNVLGVCNQNMNFVYVLSGWEGSASDSRILRDAITRRNGLKIPVGCYYLVDAGYTNGRGFLSPYRNVRYHVNEWVQGHRAPQNHLELFNKKHSSARNVIERCFGLLKKRWAILRSPSFYPIRIQSHIIITCCLLQNFIRMNMDVDLEEDATLLPEHIPVGDDTIVDEPNTIDVVESSHEWTQWREDQAIEMQEADAGQFKPEAFQKLADKMNEKFSGCGLTVKHIRNKHKCLKEKYMFVAEMLSCSSFGWNSEKMCVEVD